MFFTRRFGLKLGALALFGALMVTPLLGADWKNLPGHVPSGLARFKSSGLLPDSHQIRLAIGLPLRDSARLEEFLAEVYNPASPRYRHYLTPEEFTARFGPTEQDYEAVKQFARDNGLTILETHANRLVLDVAGSPSAVERALHVVLRNYQHPAEGRQFYAPDTEPSVAADLPVADIQGLSDFSRPEPHLKKANFTAMPNAGTGGGGNFMGDDFRNAYAAGTSLTGAGQMVGLVQFDGFYASDIAAYAAAAGGGRTNIIVQTVLLNGYNGVPTSGAGSGSAEVCLDIEMAMAMAPGLAKILVFEAGPYGNPNDVLNAMAAHSEVKNLSSSWGWSGGPSTTMDNIFKQMAAQGQTYFNASGDSDAFTVGVNSSNGVDNPSRANAPSSSPYITQVGGTTLGMSGAGVAFTAETVWNWGGGTGSSGGISSYYSLPSWQQNISMTANLGSSTQRNIPDVAMTADDVMVIYNHGSTGSFGGTSCAAPLWAGFMALVNEQAATLGNPAPGFINPAIYTIGKGQNTNYSYADCFHDTTSGNNFSSASPAGYPAVTGYDLCTGWGSPNGIGLINALAGVAGNTVPGSTNVVSSPTNTIVVASSTNGVSLSPLSGFSFGGVMGGPFLGGAATFQLTNESAWAAGWSLLNTSKWMTVSASNGTLPGFATASSTASFTTSAKTLKMGNYTNWLRFINPVTRTVRQIPVTLQVTQPMMVSPASGFAAAGPVGGTFTPSSQSLVISNFSGSALSWSLVKTSTWLTVSASSGSIPAGGHATVAVTLAASAKTLKAATYAGNVRFNNLGGTIAVVPFTLAITPPLVANGGFEAGRFTSWSQTGNTAATVVSRGSASYFHSGAYGASLGPSGTPGFLSQEVTTVPGQTYKLSLWLRNAAGATPNWFRVQWDGATIFEQTNITSRNWTNLQFLVTASASSTALQLGFQDKARSFLGLDDVTLQPVVTTSIRSTVKKSADFQLVWNTNPDTTYQAQFKTNLCQPDWVNLSEAVSASGSTLSLTDTNALQLSPQRFYRLLELP